MKVLITGADGFIARNLEVRLRELREHSLEILRITRADGDDALAAAAGQADFVFHLAGVNRPADEAEFETGNHRFTALLCDALAADGRAVPLVFSSSTKATEASPYGASKLAAEQCILDYGTRTGAPVAIFRLPNVFGKWARPNYNSAVATFCARIARSEAIDIHDPAAPLTLVYIDDVVDALVALLGESPLDGGFREVTPSYPTTVGEVADIIRSFPASRETLITPRVGQGLVRALYSTYLTYLTPDQFEYSVPIHADPRGEFVEMLKTEDSGQFSYFTAKPGITRGDHYHHSKAEKFLVIAGHARFAFRHIETGEIHEIEVRGGEGRIVETIPGWTHNISNIGNEELVVMLWANEIFDRNRPDTISMKVA